jgi:thiol-disulfide isomerase/thioredoxin
MNQNSEFDPNTPSPAGPEASPQPNRGRALLTLGVIVIGAALLLYSAHRYASSQALPTGALHSDGTNQPAPDFTLRDIHGNSYNFGETTQGKVVILNFWATWCAPCKVEIPWFIELYDRYRAEGLEIVGVAMDDEGARVVRPFAERFKMNYPVVIGDENVANLYGGIYGLPMTFIIDREGRIYTRHMGLVSLESFQETIKKLL